MNVILMLHNGLPQVLKKATIRKEQEPDFEEKRFNVTIGEDEREFDKENEFFRDRGYRITREIRDPGYDAPEFWRPFLANVIVTLYIIILHWVA